MSILCKTTVASHAVNQFCFLEIVPLGLNDEHDGPRIRACVHRRSYFPRGSLSITSLYYIYLYYITLYYSWS